MRGYNVLQPMGWDAFGLPAENAAMANGVPPARWTYDNIAYMKSQLQSLGFAIDWSARARDLQARLLPVEPVALPEAARRASPTRKTGVVNWDPVDQTVLANEQVIDGAAGAPARWSRSARSRCTTCASPTMPRSCSPRSTSCPAGPSASS